MITLSVILIVAAIILAIVGLAGVASRVNLAYLAILFLGIAMLLPRFALN